MIIASHTDVGMKRTVNQDYHITKKYSKKTSLSVVCDGMGGAKGGEEASKLAAISSDILIIFDWSALTLLLPPRPPFCIF